MNTNEFKTLYDTPSLRSESFETEKFTTQNIILSTYKLIDEKASLGTLCSRLIGRATKKFDSTYKLTRYLYSLNGALFKANTIKLGDYQVFLLAIKILNQELAEENLFNKAIELLKEIFLSPLLVNGKFKEDYFNEEKNNLLSEIRDLINDRSRYAIEKFIKIMCKNEKFGLSNLGSEEEVNKISNSELSYYYSDEILRENRFLHFIGEFKKEDMERVVDIFKVTSKPKEDKEECIEIITKHKPEVVVEEEQIQQTWLFMGYRHNIQSNSPLYGALLLFNAIFGKFSTSRLFVSLREKMGLCYYIRSSLPANKNILIVSSALMWKNYKNIVENTEKIRLNITKEIRDSEFDTAKKLVVSGLNSIGDDPLNLISLRIEFLLKDPSMNLGKLKKWVEETKKAYVKKVANELWLDTIYALKGEM